MNYIIKDIRDGEVYDERTFEKKTDAIEYLKNLIGFFKANGLALHCGEGNSHYSTYKFDEGIELVFEER